MRTSLLYYLIGGATLLLLFFEFTENTVPFARSLLWKEDKKVIVEERENSILLGRPMLIYPQSTVISDSCISMVINNADLAIYNYHNGQLCNLFDKNQKSTDYNTLIEKYIKPKNTERKYLPIDASEAGIAMMPKHTIRTFSYSSTTEKFSITMLLGTLYKEKTSSIDTSYSKFLNNTTDSVKIYDYEQFFIITDKKLRVENVFYIEKSNYPANFIGGSIYNGENIFVNNDIPLSSRNVDKSKAIVKFNVENQILNYIGTTDIESPGNLKITKSGAVNFPIKFHCVGEKIFASNGKNIYEIGSDKPLLKLDVLGEDEIIFDFLVEKKMIHLFTSRVSSNRKNEIHLYSYNTDKEKRTNEVVGTFFPVGFYRNKAVVLEKQGEYYYLITYKLR